MFAWNEKSHDSFVPTEILIGNTVLHSNPRFHILFFSPKVSAREIPLDLLSRVNVFNGNIGADESSKLEINYEFMNFIDPDRKKEIMSERLFELRRNVQVTRKVSSLLKMISEYGEEDQSKLALISKEKNELVEIITRPVYLQKEVNNTFASIEKTVDLCRSMWLALAQYLSPSLGGNFYKIQQYTNAIRQGISNSGLRTS